MEIEPLLLAPRKDVSLAPRNEASWKVTPTSLDYVVPAESRLPDVETPVNDVNVEVETVILVDDVENEEEEEEEHEDERERRGDGERTDAVRFRGARLKSRWTKDFDVEAQRQTLVSPDNDDAETEGLILPDDGVEARRRTLNRKTAALSNVNNSSSAIIGRRELMPQSAPVNNGSGSSNTTMSRRDFALQSAPTRTCGSSSGGRNGRRKTVNRPFDADKWKFPVDRVLRFELLRSEKKLIVL